MVLLSLKRLEIPPGQRILLKEVSWSEFEQILEELGEHRSSKLAYHYPHLEIMTPLPEHESNKEIISDLLKILLEEFGIEFYSLGSTTFKNKLMQMGLEPDNCFYIENEAKIRGKDRLDLTVDPPPDLALEIDVTSRTHLDIYAQLGVPEVWQFEKGNLMINVLENGEYSAVEYSPYFPNLPIKQMIPQSLKQVKREGRNQTMKAFRNWVSQQIH